MEHVKEVTKNGYKIIIDYDNYPESPREWDNLGTMICLHNRYNLGDTHNYEIEETEEIYKSKKYIALPLFLYDHSGITISTNSFSCSWDSSQIGIIFVSKEKIRKEFNVKRITKKLENTIITYLQNEVETYDQFLTGQIFSYSVYDKNNNMLDSCYGFYDVDDCLNEALASVNYYIHQNIKNHCTKLKSWIKNKVNIDLRCALTF